MISAPVLDRPRPSRFAGVAFLLWGAITALWWALAFAPLPIPAATLDRFRAVCFGSIVSGLPDSYGWMLLILGPASMLVFLVVVWGPELLSTARWLARRAAGVALLAGLSFLFAAGGLWATARIAAGVKANATTFGADATLAVEGLPAGYPRGREAAPALSLVDQRGDRLDLASLRGRPVLVTFAYAHCTTVCPVLVDTLRRAAAQAAASRPAVLVVTLDPWRDTPASLPDLAENWRLGEIRDARLLSGSVDEVTAALAAWGVDFQRDAQNGEVAHPALAYVLDPEGRIAYRFLNPPAEWLVDAVDRVRREAA